MKRYTEQEYNDALARRREIKQMSYYDMLSCRFELAYLNRLIQDARDGKEVNRLAKWTEEEMTILRANYNKIPIRQLAELLPARTPRTIASAALRIGITGKRGYKVNQRNK